MGGFIMTMYFISELVSYLIASYRVSYQVCIYVLRPLEHIVTTAFDVNSSLESDVAS